MYSNIVDMQSSLQYTTTTGTNILSAYKWKFAFSPEYYQNLRIAFTLQDAIGQIGSFSLVLYLILNLISGCIRVAHFKYDLVTTQLKVR